MYAQLIERINSQTEGDAALGRKVLSELLVAQEPMTVAKLLDGVARDAGWERTSDPIQVEKRIARCMRCCGVIVARNGNIIGLIHYTAKEYLERYGV